MRWRASSYSSGNGECVELATEAKCAPVRDSKSPTGPILVFRVESWTAFVDEIDSF
ncbi:DUF397 domain-containing protein [Streptomyces sedi]